MSAQSDTPKHAPDAADKTTTDDSPVHPAFSSPNADIVLRSKDGTLFRISSETLSRSSAWFRSMLTLPQGAAQPAAEPISVDESEAVLEALLSMISGIELPALDDADFLEAILNAADKYEMPMALAVLRTALFSPFLPISPLRLYGLARRMSWTREATHAAQAALSLDLLAPASLPELVRLEPAHQSALLASHRARREALVAGLDDPQLFGGILHDGGGAGALMDDGELCHNPLDHSTWHALKYALLRQFERAPPGAELGSAFFTLPEVGAMYGARCAKCGQANYVMPNLLEGLAALVRDLPRGVEDGVGGGSQGRIVPYAHAGPPRARSPGRAGRDDAASSHSATRSSPPETRRILQEAR
ncbi:uncharacterized protein TRAVEDRAFT_159341 [Trametes versicolor FP-101664 SS1]|uniref:uncharacterized protein n=1 Tax=Trametes versicolor (strain FP-101664) TaxID=717944 RepID=UPI0004623924|nr:uncharacterized protein TRAVEDRAFT_159341 [Trametes versicolor FP-101664 SS1]EIW64737.1 hypothetical protein TRAVEDRAFT_159341 [Trametes versicolor FP-101664 SS1]